MDISAETILRQAIFDHLEEMARDTGVVTREQLSRFTVDGEVHRLIDHSRGIRNPADMHGTLSILSDPQGRYADEDVTESLFAYAYREGSTAGDNKKLRRAYELRLPFILLRKIKPGLFVPIFPVYAVADDPANRRFLIALDETLLSVDDPLHLHPLEKKYAERITKQRLHQPEFRGRVLHAYSGQCTVCNLKHGPLLDAAHIISDAKPHGNAEVSNGLSLCKIHHAAYDRNYLGITPNYQVEINRDLLEEEDGPMLKHGLQEMHGRAISLPHRSVDKPSRDRLAERYAEFANSV
ncbi:HNH endonuclease [Nocardia sienata]|uniref:HNH endonuclease n=1 Tax=Nocardia sienata TaxID=248552 RepID=UPI000A7AE6BD|nr:HNH endonuclease [Nocardia sienata]